MAILEIGLRNNFTHRSSQRETARAEGEKLEANSLQPPAISGWWVACNAKPEATGFQDIIPG